MAIPENAIVVDESITTGAASFRPTRQPTIRLAAEHGRVVDFRRRSRPVRRWHAPTASCLHGRRRSAMYTCNRCGPSPARPQRHHIVFANRIYQIAREFDGRRLRRAGTTRTDMLKSTVPRFSLVLLLAKARGVAGAPSLNHGLTSFQQ